MIIIVIHLNTVAISGSTKTITFPSINWKGMWSYCFVLHWASIRAVTEKSAKSKESAFSAIYDKQIARRLECWSGGEASARMNCWYSLCDRKSHHRSALKSTQLNSTHLIVIMELKFVFPIVLLLISFVFVCLFVRNSFRHGICLQAKTIMFLFGLPKAFCAKWLLSTPKQREREICKQRRQQQQHWETAVMI